jgi:hypothetical protein
MTEKLDKNERKANPAAQYIWDLGKFLEPYIRKGYKIILAGDTNINLNKDDTAQRDWKAMMMDLGLVNTMQEQWGVRNYDTFPRYKSWIDHIHIDSMSAINGALLGAGIEKGHTFYKSDHNAVGAKINMSVMIGRTSTDKTLYKPPKRVVKCAIPESKEEYHETHKEKHQDILTKSNKVMNMALQIKRTGRKK